MKVEKIDMLWAAVSMIILGVAMHRRNIPNGILMIYALMAVLFAYHIWRKRRSLKGSVEVFGTVVDYHTSQKVRGSFPVVQYTTAGGREITSVYTVEERKQKYSIGEEVLVRYDPDEPMFFYFSGREDELTRDYFRFIIYGGAAALLMLIIKLA
jgi:hypothetical protein